jgi:chromosome segregation ATPase
MSPSGCRLRGVLFFSFALLLSSPAAGGESPFRLEVDSSAAGAAGEWAGEALELYLDSYAGAASSSLAPKALPPFSIKARVLMEGKDLVFLVRLETGEGQIAESELRGAPAEAARWLSDLALVVERTVLADSGVSVSWQGPASSTAALRLFLDSGRTESLEARTRLLQDSLAKDPTFAEARWQLGVVLYAWGRFEEALEAFEKYLEVRPSSSRAAHNSGLCAARMGGGPGEGKAAAGGEGFFLVPYRTASSRVWLTALPEVAEAWPEDVKAGPVPDPAGRESGDPPQGAAGLPVAEEGSSSAEVERYQRRNRALEDLAREKDQLAIRLAREALAAQKDLREARKRIVELESGEDAAAGPLRAEGDTTALSEDPAGVEEELGRLRAETRSLEKEKGRMAEALAGEEAKSLALEETSGKAAILEKERDELQERNTMLTSRIGEIEEEKGRMAEALAGAEAKSLALEETSREGAAIEKERDELKERNTMLASRISEIENAGEEAASLRERRKESREEHEVLEKKRAGLAAGVKELEAAAAALTDSIEEGRREREALEVELAGRRGEVQAAQEQTVSLQASLEEVWKERGLLEETLKAEGELRRTWESEAEEQEAAIAGLRDGIARGEAALKEAEVASEKCETRAAEAEERVAETLSGKVVLEESVAALQTARDSAVGELARRNEGMQAVTEREEASRERAEELAREKAGLEERLAELGVRLGVLEKEIAAGQSSAGELEVIREERNSLAAEKGQLEAAIAELRDGVARGEAAVKEAEEASGKFETRAVQAEGRAEELAREKVGLEERLGEAEARLATLEKEIAAGESSSEELEVIREERNSLAAEKERLEAEAAGRREEGESLRADLSRLQAELDTARGRSLALERERDALKELNLRLVRKVKDATMRSLALERAAASP